MVSMQRVKKKRIVFFVTAAAAALLILAVLSDYIYFRNRIYPGVYIKNIDLGGKSYGEAAAALASAQITFKGPASEEAFSVTLKEMGIFLDEEQIMSMAFSQGRQSCWPRSYCDRQKIKKERVFLPFSYRLDQKIFSQGISSLKEIFSRSPRDAYFKVTGDYKRVEVITEKIGYSLKEEELKARLLQNLAQPHTPLTIIVPCEEISPAVTASALQEKGIEALMSTFTTSFDQTKVNRVHNIKLAAGILDGYIMAPGDVLSLNELFGDTTPEKGYKEAPIIVGGEMVPGFGGGLCQISSTLYNAALLADLEMLERHHHELTVPYLPPGRDATLAYGARDLKIRNNKEHHILIKVAVEKDKLTFWLYGLPLEERVVIKTKQIAVYAPPIKYEYDPDLLPGEEEIIAGYPGYTVEVWKLVYQGGRLVREEKISVDSYFPYPALVKQGRADGA